MVSTSIRWTPFVAFGVGVRKVSWPDDYFEIHHFDIIEATQLCSKKSSFKREMSIYSLENSGGLALRAAGATTYNFV
jgi:hypothetical protein